MYYQLISPIKVPKTLNVIQSKNGYHKHGYMRLDPGKKYEVPDDPVLFEAITSAKEKTRYSKDLENALKEAGVEYKVSICGGCGGRARKLEYKLVEVVE